MNEGCSESALSKTFAGREILQLLDERDDVDQNALVAKGRWDPGGGGWR
jgi:hypothetical protein